MVDEIRVKNSVIQLVKGDITDFEIECFVYYARNDLALGSGFGTAISVRGGPTIQEELNEYGGLETTEVVVTSAGRMKAEYIIHAVGPKFHEENMENKLIITILNCLKKADERKIKSVAFPPMGAGFYGVPLDDSARITLETISEYLSGETRIEKVIVCLFDNREYESYRARLRLLQKEV